MILFCDARPNSDDRAFLCPLEVLKPYEAIRGNPAMLIPPHSEVGSQQWCGLAGDDDRPQRADIYNIYGSKDLIPVSNPFMMGVGHGRV